MNKKKQTMRKDQRRVAGGLVAVPIYTLCQVQEDSGDIFLTHDSRNLIVAGDVIRVGSTLARDYIVSLRSKALVNTHPKTIVIEPAYDLIGEDDFELPTCGLNPTPAIPAVNPRNGKPILPNYSKWGFKYDLPAPKRNYDLSDTLDGKINLKDAKNRTIGKEKTVKTVKGEVMNEEDELDAAVVRAKVANPKEGGLQVSTRLE